VTVPIGTGIVYAGMNDARVHDNWIFDNWRDGAMLFAVPDALTTFGGAEGEIYPGVSCLGAPENGISTSCGNHYSDNRVGQVPPGFEFPAALDEFGVPHGDPGQQTLPNGNDFWWDEFLSNRWNCWFGNTGPDGTAGSVTGSGDAGRTPGIPPNPLPDCAGGTNQDLSIGTGDAAKEAYLLDCSEGPDDETGPLDCDWWTPPPRPGSAEAATARAEFAAAAGIFEGTPEADRLRLRMEELAANGGR
jgi:hypothetical protein